jgi:hypothetical protein
MRRIALPLTIAATVPLGVWLTQAVAAGGLSVTPAVIDKTATKGAVAPLTLRNTTSGALKITVTPRPWKQARSGDVVPDRKKTLASSLSVSVPSFTLPAGASRTVTLDLKAVPAAGSLYGSVETVGLPVVKKSKGITAGYRLVSSLRLNPTASRRTFAISPGSKLKLSGRAVSLAVKSRGNTIDPISGTARVKGPAGTRTVTIAGRRILPGATVDLPVTSTKGLPAGTYTARIVLVQAGKTLRTINRGFRVK